MQRIFRSLTFKLGIVIVAVQVAITALAGAYYVSHFSSQAEERIRSQIKIPGVLMNKGLLNYDAISKRDVMQQILGDDLHDAIIFGYDRTVYQSIDSADIGKNLDQLSGKIELTNFTGEAKDLVFDGQDANGRYIASVTPIYSAAGQAPFLFAYIKIATKNLQQEQTLLTVFILLASLMTVILTSLTIFFLLRWVLFGNINKLRRAADMVSQGQLGSEVVAELPRTQDELGQLSDAFRTMINRLQATYRDLAEKQARLRASINSLTLGFIMVDHNHTIVNINPAALNMFGKVLDAKGSRLDQLQKALQGDVDLLKSINECIASGRPQEFKEVVFGNHYLHILLAPITLEATGADEKLGVVMLFEDVTEERIMARSKDEFFSIASHELRTPLTAIRGNTDMILGYYTEAVKDPDLKEMLTDIHGSSVRLIEIVNDFLDASRLEQGKMKFTPEAFSISEVVEKVVYELSSIVNEKHIYLKMTDGFKNLPIAWGDKNHVKQIVYNLTGNAAKFVEKGGITVDAKVEGKLIKVYVTDTGKGISRENQQILFHKFQQATSSIITRDNTRGTGLGLYISRLLIEGMGGKIALEHSEEGKGSTFSFSLPIATSKQIAAQAAAAQLPPKV